MFNNEWKKMKNVIRLWNFDGFVYLKEEFVKVYKKKVKKYGVTKLSKRLNIDYGTTAFYRRNKLIGIKFLKNVCNILKIDKCFAERSAKLFTQNLKSYYNINFPIKLTPLHLRAVSMIIGDGSGSLDECCVWTQNFIGMKWGIKLFEKIINFTPTDRDAKNSNCKIIGIPNFLVESIALFLRHRSRKIKSYEFFKNICKLHRKWQFQVFAQLVVDEGTPDKTFIISQRDREVKNGIIYLIRKLGYHFSEVKNGIYICTESFPLIRKDLKTARNNFGKLGGFWFKDNRFKIACSVTNPNFSKNSRLYNNEFTHVLNKIKKLKKIFTYNELKKSVAMPEEALTRRIRRSLKNKIIIKVTHGFYTFPNYVNDKNVIWLNLSKEEKVLNVFSKYNYINTCKLLEETHLSVGGLYRALENLINDGKIQKTDWRRYKIITQTVQ